MHEHIPILDGFLDQIEELFEKLRNILSLAIKQGEDYMFDADLRIIQVIHAQCGCDYFVVREVPVAIEWEWMKLRLWAALRSPRKMLFWV